ncbi:hypothetical protein [Proteus sp. ZN5]|uniref:hypothetical protein n=1 Tax=Proteus sp. ZN5 TaxID=2697019 RepID=UPI0013E174CF|nr:hypothetical protein [Proteus sp. ZN5]QIG07080.1 hypothetical protein GTK47_17835 [Proteus sp. ZN5]
MTIEKIDGALQGSSLNLSNQSSSFDFNFKSSSILLIENSVNKISDVRFLNDKDLIKDEPIYMEMSKNVDNITNSYEVNYDDNSDSYIFDNSLSIKNKNFNFFVDLSIKETESIFNNLKNKNYDVNKLKIINSSVEGFMVDSVEENIYETMNNDCYLSEKLDLIDSLSEIVSKNKKTKGSFKDNLIRSLNDVSLNELFSLCEEYEEQYEVEEFFLISRFIFRFIEEFNKLNNNKIKLNEDLKRGINSVILLKSLKFKDNNII